jgi:ABC-2 type transport system permease protein
VELIRFAFYERVAWDSLALVLAFTTVFAVGALIAYDPAKGMLMRKGG